MPQLLANRSAIITGAGRGIGRATARLFAEHGARLFLTDRDPQPLTLVAEEVRDSGGVVHTLPGDVAAREFPRQLIAKALASCGGIDVLVNNAGFTWDGLIHKMTDEQWQAILDVHLTAPFRIIREAATFFRESARLEAARDGVARARKIINVSSTSGTRGNFGQANYAAAKAGIVGLTKTLAKEWGAFNIQVNCVAFGLIDTRLTAPKETGERLQVAGSEVALGIPPTLRDTAIKMIPLGRPGNVQEAAGPILFLASALADYVSGHVLEVTGGL